MTTVGAVKKPMDLVRLSLDEVVLVKCRGDRDLRGKLHAFDEHMNLVLGNVEETTRTYVVDNDTQEEIVKSSTRKIPMMFVRGDVVVLVSPPVRT